VPLNSPYLSSSEFADNQEVTSKSCETATGIPAEFCSIKDANTSYSRKSESRETSSKNQINLPISQIIKRL
jgi:hypothetical protein